MKSRRSLEENREVLYRYFDYEESFADEVDKRLRAFVKDEPRRGEVDSHFAELPSNAIQAIKKAKEEAGIAARQADAANERAEAEAERASGIALDMAYYAAEDAIAGKLDRAKQSFSKAIAGTTTVGILLLAFEFYMRTGDIDTAEDVARRWFAVSAHASTDLAQAFTALGMVHKTRGNLNEAEAMYRKSLAPYEQLGHKQGFASPYSHLGTVHQSRGDLLEAEAMHKKSLALNLELGSKARVATDLGNLGIV
jgi:tetratricopeptide (TPR) repeat protein